MGLNEPPEITGKTEVSQPAEFVPLSNEMANAIWLEFASGQGPRISSLMKLLSARVEGTDMIVTAGSMEQLESLEEIRMPFTRFVLAKTNEKILRFLVERGEVKDTERRPYTDKEKLDYMLKKHPEWQEMIEKLHLRLP